MSVEMTPALGAALQDRGRARSEPDHALLTAADWPNSFLRIETPPRAHARARCARARRSRATLRFSVCVARVAVRGVSVAQSAVDGGFAQIAAIHGRRCEWVRSTLSGRSRRAKLKIFDLVNPAVMSVTGHPNCVACCDALPFTWRSLSGRGGESA